MSIRFVLCIFSVAAFGAAPGADGRPRALDARVLPHGPAGYQVRREPEQTERFSRRIRLGRDGRVSISNISGDITITGGSGEDLSIEAVKRTRGDRSRLSSADIEVEERGGRVDVRTIHSGRNDRVSVDYTLTVPASASIDAKSVSGDVKVNGVRGVVRVEAVSGNVTTAGTPKVEQAKSVSGDVDLSDVSSDSDLSAGSVSGSLRARGLKSRAVELNSVSGDVVLTGVSCERLAVKSVSGNVEYSGTLAKGGRYEVNTHSGTVRLGLSGNTGFELDGNTFSGSIRSELPLTTSVERDADRRGRRNSIHATFGDGSAILNIRTFSGDIVITRR